MGRDPIALDVRARGGPHVSQRKRWSGRVARKRHVAHNTPLELFDDARRQLISLRISPLNARAGLGERDDLIVIALDEERWNVHQTRTFGGSIV